MLTLLFQGGDIPPDATERRRPCSGAKTTGDFLLDFHHPQIPFGQVVVKRQRKVIHEGEGFSPVLGQPVQQVFRFALLLAPTPAGRQTWRGLLQGQSLRQNRLVTTLKLFTLTSPASAAAPRCCASATAALISTNKRFISPAQACPICSWMKVSARRWCAL